ncbi:MAG: hypothetical protein WCJ71_08380 [Candidatus Omnitrophota bacterium]
MRKKIVVILSTLALSLNFVPLQEALSREDTLVIESVQTVEGSVQDLDSGHNRVTVHWMNDEVLFTYQDLTLDVTDSTAILKEGRTIRLDDLETGDHVTLRYDANAEPLPRALSIVVAET